MAILKVRASAVPLQCMMYDVCCIKKVLLALVLNHILCAVLFEVWMSCFVKLLFPRLMRNFSLKSVCLSLFLMGINLCKKILMTVLAMAKAILLATACCFCCRAVAQTNKPSNHQHLMFYSPIDIPSWLFEQISSWTIYPQHTKCNNMKIKPCQFFCVSKWGEFSTTVLFMMYLLFGLTTYWSAKTSEISVVCIFTQSKFETRSDEMLGMIYPPLSLFTISQFISPFKPA